MTEPDDDRFRILEEDVPPASEANDLVVMATALLGGLAGVAFGVLLLVGTPVAVHGSALALALLLLGVAFRRYFVDRFPDVVAAEAREEQPADEDPVPVAAIAAIPRRRLLGRVLAVAAGLLGLGLAAPVVSLGPAPNDVLHRTPWRAGTRLVMPDGRPLRPGDVAPGGISTVWPEDAIEVEVGAVILVRLSGGPAEPPTNPDWVIDGEVVAYSKVCTHAGCPVGLFRERDDALFCPCHQSTFDARRGAVPTFGPAARALPQLPLGVDEQGFLVALDDFVDQVGPAFG